MINKVDGPGGVRPSAPARRAGKSEKTSSASFSQHLSEEGAGAQGVSGLNSVAGISALIGIQEVDDATQRASKGKKRATRMLDQLDELRMALVTGGLNKEQLVDLAATVKSEKTAVDDPRLASILDDIDLRAQVELAKYTS